VRERVLFILMLLFKGPADTRSDRHSEKNSTDSSKAPCTVQFVQTSLILAFREDSRAGISNRAAG
jgi:hypothetical protein